MLALHKQRSPNGFTKSLVANVKMSLQLVPTTFAYRIIPATIVKAANAGEQETKVSSTKIKIIGVLVRLWVQARDITATDFHVLRAPFAIEVFRQAQTVANENQGRYAANTAHILKHTFQTGEPVADYTGYSLCSPYNLPLDIESKGFVKLYTRRLYESASIDVSKFDANTMNNATYQAPIVYVDMTIPCDCILEVADDSVSQLMDSCVGEIPEVHLLTLYNRKRVAASYQPYGEYFLMGTIQYVYQECGTKLSHLI